jgi:hypothetical protein
MDLTALQAKIERLYEAAASTTESDLAKFPPLIEAVGNWITLRQDFNRGLNQAQLNNAAYQVVRAIADLKDHLRRAARHLKFDAEEVEKTINASVPLQLMIDLANLDKHGGHDRVKAQRSKRSPRLTNVRGALQITTTAGDLGAGGMIGIRLTSQGAVPFGSGKSAVILTGDLVDESGTQILELNFAQTAAIDAWESLFSRLGIVARSSPPT